MTNQTRALRSAVATLALLAGLASGSSAFAGTIEFFQTKPEAIATFDAIIAQFEAEYPEIDVEQVSMPDPGTVLRTRMVRNDLPDVISTGGDNTYGDLADAGVLMDFTGSPLVATLQPSYIDMIGRLTSVEGIFGLPYTANANTVLYNKEIFAANGWTVPTTWDDFIAIADAAKAAGITPFYHTYLDSWTIMVPLNSLASNLQSADFVEARATGTTSFAAQYREVAEKLLTLQSYGHADNFGVGYDDGNRAFAAGESAMLIQGVWAAPAILANNPKAQIGAFALPVGNDPAANKLISGVDSLFAISAATDNRADAETFIAYLQRPEVAQQYIDAQKQFSAIQGVFQNDPMFDDLKPYFETGRITSFADHYYPAGMNVSTLAQEFLLDGNVDAFLEKLDTDWDAVAQR